MIQYRENDSIEQHYFGAEYRRASFTERTPSISDSADISYRVVVS